MGLLDILGGRGERDFAREIESAPMVPAAPLAPDAPPGIVQEQHATKSWQQTQLKQAEQRLDRVAMRAGAHQMARMRNLKATNPAEYARRFGDLRGVKPEELPAQAQTVEEAIQVAKDANWQDVERPADADIVPLTTPTSKDRYVEPLGAERAPAPRVRKVEVTIGALDVDNDSRDHDRIIISRLRNAGMPADAAGSITMRQDGFNLIATWTDD